MLKKLHRLKKKKDFDIVFKNGKSKFSKILGIKIFSNNLDESRFGIIVSKKVSKKAVERNKIKRQIREILRLSLSEIKPGYDIIVIVSPNIMGSTYDKIKDSLFFCLKKISLIQYK